MIIGCGIGTAHARRIEKTIASIGTRAADVWAYAWKTPSSACAMAVLRTLFPRIDFPVTADPTHMIKCPYSPHAKTGWLEYPYGSDISEARSLVDVLGEEGVATCVVHPQSDDTFSPLTTNITT